MSDYHDHPAIGSSALREFRNSPSAFYARYIAKTLPHKPQTEAMVFGSLLHTWVLEPDQIRERYAVSEKFDRRTKEGKAAFASFAEANTGKEIVPLDDFLHCRGLAKAIKDHPEASQLLDRCQARERPVFWTDKETGLDLKCKPDAADSMPCELVCDIKTCSGGMSPREFSRTVYQFGYHLQAAQYLDGTKADRFVFIVVSKEPPFPVACYELDAAALELGYEQYRSALMDLAALKDQPAEAWKADYERGVWTIGLPEWASKTEQNWSVNGD